MLCPKCGSGSAAKLCPVSFGLAIGIVSFIAVLLWSLWVMSYGMSPMMAAMHIPMPTLSSSFVHALVMLIKGFVCGFFVALLYDLIVNCCARCKSGEDCVCCLAPKKNGKR